MRIMKIHFTKLFCDRRYKMNCFIFQILKEDSSDKLLEKFFNYSLVQRVHRFFLPTHYLYSSTWKTVKKGLSYKENWVNRTINIIVLKQKIRIFYKILSSCLNISWFEIPPQRYTYQTIFVDIRLNENINGILIFLSNYHHPLKQKFTKKSKQPTG